MVFQLCTTFYVWFVAAITKIAKKKRPLFSPEDFPVGKSAAMNYAFCCTQYFISI